MPGRDLEVRVLIIAQMLDKAIAELRGLAAEIQGGTSTLRPVVPPQIQAPSTPPPMPPPPPPTTEQEPES